ncbi:unnamed protein product, partial [Hymenolepis diminuta]
NYYDNTHLLKKVLSTVFYKDRSVNNSLQYTICDCYSPQYQAASRAVWEC